MCCFCDILLENVTVISGVEVVRATWTVARGVPQKTPKFFYDVFEVVDILVGLELGIRIRKDARLSVGRIEVDT